MRNVNITDFICGTDTQSLRAAAKYLRDNPNTRLVLENREYLLRDDRAVSLQQTVMRGDYGNDPEKTMFKPEFEYVSGIDLTGAENVEICGNGARILIDGFMEPFTLSYCRGVTLTDFSIDHIRKPYSRGTVWGSGENYTDVRFGGLSMISENMPTPRIIVYSAEKNRFVNVYYASHKELIDANTIRFFGFSHKTAGDSFYAVNTFHSRPAVLIYKANDTTLKNITIHSQPGMGIVGHLSENIAIDCLCVTPSTGEEYSVNTDATHFASCRGFLKIENSSFCGHGDDAVNVHTYYHTVISQSCNKCRLRLDAPTFTHSQKPDTFEKGDVLELCSPENLCPDGHYTVVECKSDGQINEVTLDRPLPDKCIGMYLADISALPRFTFRNNSVFNHLARAVLVKTRNVLIENNDIRNSTGTAIHIAAEGSWCEGVSSENVVVRNNKITDCGIVGHGRIHGAGGICIKIEASTECVPAHRNIVIENNEISCPDTPYAIYASDVVNLEIRNNTCVSAGEPIVTLPYKGEKNE